MSAPWVQCTSVSNECLGGCRSLKEHDAYRRQQADCGHAGDVGRACGRCTECVRHELARSRAENDRLRGALESIASEFERAVREADRPRGGQHVQPGGDFVSAIRLPSFVSRARWWARELRAALNGGRS